jgi:two-component system, NarL family, nitrate/nitrite response regulator NarL
MSEPGRPIRILIADDHPILRDGLRRLLEVEPGFSVVGEAADGEVAVELAAKVDADVLLLDLAMPRLSGLEVLGRLARSGRPLLTIILTAGIDRDEIVRALQLGARGVVVKESATELLNASIRAVVAGKYWLGHEGIGDLVQALRRLSGSVDTSPPPMTRLTPRELEIISGVVEGASNREIGDQLGLSTQTVKNHLSSIFDKLGVSSRLELALFAVHHHLLDRAPRPE